ncbi:hypothetical protein BH10ACT7_BH10ACT7_11250 [soil metagenome]
MSEPFLQRIRSRFRPIHVAPLLAIIALGAWMFASPIGSSPDDDFHLTSIWCANDARTDLCEPGPSPAERVVPAVVLGAPCFAYNEESSATCQTALLEKPFEPSVVTGRGSFEHNYPPVFYGFMNVFASDNLLVSALVMRFINILLFVGLSVALFMLLPSDRRSTMLWAWTLTLVPLGLFLIASNNPSSWAIIGVGSSWLALLGFFESTGRRQVGLGIVFGLATVMAAGARGDAALYTILGSVMVGFLTFARTRAWALRAILPVAMAVVAGLFFLASRQSQVAVTGLGDSVSSDIPLSGFGLLAYNLLNVPQLWAGIFGGWPLGWLDTTMPAVVIFGGLGVFVAVVFIGLGILSWRKVIAALGVVLVLWLLPTVVLMQGGNAVGQNVQPRYLLPIIIVLAGVAMLSVGNRFVRLGRAQTLLIGVALSVGQAFALHVNMRRYLTGTDIQGGNLDDGAEWWWNGLIFSPMAVWVIGAAAFTGLVVIILRHLRKSDYELVS